MAGRVLAVGVLLGLLLAKFTVRVTPLWRRVVTVVLACSLPLSMLLGVWPFDPRWNYDCGFTPDPNLRVQLATVAFPLVTIAFAWLARRFRYARP